VGTALRIVVIVALIAAFAVAPLFLVERSYCRERGKEKTRWSFRLPGDEPPRRCRDTENGFEILRDYVGL
jgi:hypothetical protein